MQTEHTDEDELATKIDGSADEIGPEPQPGPADNVTGKIDQSISPPPNSSVSTSEISESLANTESTTLKPTSKNQP